MPRNIADDAEEFENRWKSHIDQLQRLGVSMSVEQFEDGDFEELKELQNQLRDIVERTADNLEE